MLESVYGEYFGYFIIYSFLGYLIEVFYGLVTEGVIESRQSFLYGPINTIYGAGAILMLLPLKKINSDSKLINFITAGVLGCILEYMVSAFGEYYMHVKWWDYTNYFMNVNGRICLYFGIFWGLLGLWMLYSINPKVDAFIDKLKNRFSRKTQKVIIILTLVGLILDLIVSLVAVNLYQTRIIVENDLDVRQKAEYIERYNEVYGNEKLKKFILLIWGDDVMVKAFPDLLTIDVNGENIFLADYCPDSQRYYFKVFDKEIEAKDVEEKEKAVEIE